MSLLLALFGRDDPMQQCPLLREKRTRAGRLLTSGNDPGCVKKTTDIYEKNPKAEGLILLKHGIDLPPKKWTGLSCLLAPSRSDMMRQNSGLWGAVR
jgi:hypothetical protein